MSSWEDFFELQLQEHGVPTPQKEYKFLKNRRFRFDFAWPEFKFACEVDGAVYQRGRHTSGAGYTKDCEKFALAAIEGYRVIRVTTGQVNKGQAIQWIQTYFEKQEGIICPGEEQIK